MEDNNFNAWLAGFWEGEGSLTKFKNLKDVYRITITQTIRDDRTTAETMEKIKQIFGGNYYISNDKKYRKLARYALDKQKNVLNFLEAIYPYCHIRKNDIKKALTSFHYKAMNQLDIVNK